MFAFPPFSHHPSWVLLSSSQLPVPVSRHRSLTPHHLTRKVYPEFFQPPASTSQYSFRSKQNPEYSGNPKHSMCWSQALRLVVNFSLSLSLAVLSRLHPHIQQTGAVSSPPTSIAFFRKSHSSKLWKIQQTLSCSTIVVPREAVVPDWRGCRHSTSVAVIAAIRKALDTRRLPPTLIPAIRLLSEPFCFCALSVIQLRVVRCIAAPRTLYFWL